MKSEKWVENLIAEIAKEHRIIIENDDPVLVAALLQKKLIVEFTKEQDEIFNSFKKALAEQMIIQNEVNDKKIASLISSLKSANEDAKNTPSKQESTPPLKTNKSFFWGIFSLGLLLGVAIMLLINRL